MNHWHIWRVDCDYSFRDDQKMKFHLSFGWNRHPTFTEAYEAARKDIVENVPASGQFAGKSDLPVVTLGSKVIYKVSSSQFTKRQIVECSGRCGEVKRALERALLSYLREGYDLPIRAVDEG